MNKILISEMLSISSQLCSFVNYFVNHFELTSLLYS